jgi:hypothetical protein
VDAPVSFAVLPRHWHEHVVVVEEVVGAPAVPDDHALVVDEPRGSEEAIPVDRRFKIGPVAVNCCRN